MMSQSEQVASNVADARTLRDAGHTYRQIGRQLGLTSAQLGLVKRTLKREKAGRTRLRNRNAGAGDRDLTIGHSVLPKGLRHLLVKAGYRTLGDLADRINDADRPLLETMPGIGPHRARLVRDLLGHFGLLEGASDLQVEIERLFPDLRD
jgi:hypothetical protein